MVGITTALQRATLHTIHHLMVRDLEKEVLNLMRSHDTILFDM